MPIDYVVGDATAPQDPGNKIIVHCCNNVGAWGAGFVMALSARWSKPEEYYRWWATRDLDGYHYNPFELGQVQYVQVESTFEPGIGSKLEHIWVANLIGQNGTRSFKNPRPVDYGAISKGLKDVAEKAVSVGASVHMPRIGCGLAGGDWNVVEYIIEHSMLFFYPDLSITVYDLE